MAKARRVPVPKFDPSYLRRSLREEMQPDKEPKPVSLAPTQNRLYETLKLPPAQEAKLRSILREQKIRTTAALRGVDDKTEFDQIVSDSIAQTDKEALEALGPVKFAEYKEYYRQLTTEMARHLLRDFEPNTPTGAQ